MRDAMAYLRKACDGGSGAGCSAARDPVRAGRGHAKDEAVAASLSERGCEGGDPVGCMAFSFSVAGKDDPLGTARAVQPWRGRRPLPRRRATPGGSWPDPTGTYRVLLFSEACTTLAGACQGRESARLPSSRRAARAGTPGCLFLGRLRYRSGSRPAEGSRARGRALRASLRPETTTRDATPSVKVGEMYLSGTGMSKDAARAGRSPRSAPAIAGPLPRAPASERCIGPGRACTRTARARSALFGRASDGGDRHRLSPSQLEQGCDAGSAAACSGLGDLYYLGSSEKGVPEDGLAPPRSTSGPATAETRKGVSTSEACTNAARACPWTALAQPPSPVVGSSSTRKPATEETSMRAARLEVSSSPRTPAARLPSSSKRATAARSWPAKISSGLRSSSVHSGEAAARHHHARDAEGVGGRGVGRELGLPRGVKGLVDQDEGGLGPPERVRSSGTGRRWYRRPG